MLLAKNNSNMFEFVKGTYVILLAFSDTVYMSHTVDGFAPSTDSAVPSTDPSMVLQSVDGAALSVDAHGTDSARSVDRTVLS